MDPRRWALVLTSAWLTACASGSRPEWVAPQDVQDPLLLRGQPQAIGRALPSLIVGVQRPDEATRPMLGTLSLEDGVAIFRPRFPWRPGVPYRAELEGAEAFEFQLPRQMTPGPRSVQIFPSTGTVPENLLRIYLEFSHPMAQGRSLERVGLYDASGLRLKGAFLHIQPELWDPQGRRLTLLLDPGRIKRGVQPNRERGLALQQGKRFTLRLDPKWEDIQGMALGDPFERELVVGPPDRTPPRLQSIDDPPAHGSTDPLRVTFDEPLDRGGLEHNLTVSDPEGRRLGGETTVLEGERIWIFRPENAWRRGKHGIRIASIVGDPAGNMFERPFETRPDEPETKEGERGPATLAFWIR